MLHVTLKARETKLTYLTSSTDTKLGGGGNYNLKHGTIASLNIFFVCWDKLVKKSETLPTTIC